MDIVINYLNFNSRHHDKCQDTLKFIPLGITFNLFSLELVQNDSGKLVYEQWLSLKLHVCYVLSSPITVLI